MSNEELGKVMVEGFVKLGRDIEALDTKIDTKIDELAITMASQFKRVDERFDQIDERFEQVDERFDFIETRLDAVEVGLENVEARVIGLDGKIEVLRSEFKTSLFDSKKLKERVETIEITTFGAIQAA